MIKFYINRLRERRCLTRDECIIDSFVSFNIFFNKEKNFFIIRRREKVVTYSQARLKIYLRKLILFFYFR